MPVHSDATGGAQLGALWPTDGAARAATSSASAERPRRPSLPTGVVRWAPAAAALGYGFVALTWWVGEEWYPTWDGAIYVLVAKSLVAGEGLRYLDAPFVLRPPGFTLLVALALPDGELDPIALNRMTMGFAAATVVAIQLALRPICGAGLATAIAIATGTSGLFTDKFDWAVSDIPFMATLFVALHLLARATAPGAARHLGLWGAVALATAIHLRTIGALVIPGVLLVSALDARGWPRRPAWVSSGLAISLVAPWILYAASVDVASDLSDQLAAESYTTALLRVDPADPESAHLSIGDWADRLERKIRWLYAVLPRHMLGIDRPELSWALLALFALGLTRACLSRFTIFECFALSYAAVLIVHPHPVARHLLPLMPLLYLYAVLAVVGPDRVRDGSPLAAGSWRGRAVALLLLGLIATHVSRDVAPAPAVDEAARTRSNWWLHDLAAVIRIGTPEGAILLADDAPILSLLSDRRAYTYRMRRSRSLIAKYRPDFVVLDDGLHGPYSARSRQMLTELRRDGRFVRSTRLGEARVAIFERRTAER